jgi:hypothetical protein
LFNGLSEEEILSGGGRRFLELFEKVKVEFPDNEYPTVDWVKAKSD